MRHGLTQEFYDHVAEHPERSEIYSERERLAIEYAERFALDHHHIGPELFDRLRTHFDDGEILELTLVIGRHLAFGRLTKVLGLETTCVLPGEASDGTRTGTTGYYDC
ncbi:MAG: hypothetical protein GEU93_04500 [Propionibacteriales bacterium]|nr:hypothetical protein [Propionibacteriales bacterium]